MTEILDTVHHLRLKTPLGFGYCIRLTFKWNVGNGRINSGAALRRHWFQPLPCLWPYTILRIL